MMWHKIIIGDCLEAMKDLPNESIDLIVTDPPYGLGTSKNDILNLDFISQCNRLLKEGGGFYCFCSGKTINKFMNEFEKFDMTWLNTLIWFHENTVSHETKCYVHSYDPCLFYVKNGREHIFNLNIIREPYPKKWRDRRKTPVYRNGKPWRCNPLGRKRLDVLKFPSYVGKLFEDKRLPHIWQKNEELIECLINASSNKGDLIFDPFAGSFTTAKIAKDLGRNSISIEINPDYWENIGKNRLQVDTPSLDNSVKFEVIYLDKKLEMVNANP